MKGFRRDAFPAEAMRKDGFEHGAEIAALIAYSGQHIHELAVSTSRAKQGASEDAPHPEALKLAFLRRRLPPDRPAEVSRTSVTPGTGGRPPVRAARRKRRAELSRSARV
jgi:hypothetical protein